MQQYNTGNHNIQQNTQHFCDYPKDAEVRHGLRHGIVFGEFDSRCFNLFLHERIALTPREKEVAISIPYAHGVVDMSGILGHRVYHNRTITYIFYRFDVPMEQANTIQTTIENMLMRESNAPLYDSFDPEYFYQGKCQEVFIEDEYSYRRLRIEIVFDLHPFKKRRNLESEDRFDQGHDQFNFDLDVFHQSNTQNTLRLTLNPGETREITLRSSSKRTVRPTVTANRPGLTIERGAMRYVTLGAAEQEDFLTFRLIPGENHFRVTNPWTSPSVLVFDWRKELI